MSMVIPVDIPFSVWVWLGGRALSQIGSRLDIYTRGANKTFACLPRKLEFKLNFSGSL